MSSILYVVCTIKYELVNGADRISGTDLMWSYVVCWWRCELNDGHLMLVAVPPSNLTQSMVEQPTHASCPSHSCHQNYGAQQVDLVDMVTTTPISMHYGEVSMGGVTFRNSNF